MATKSYTIDELATLLGKPADYLRGIVDFNIHPYSVKLDKMAFRDWLAKQLSESEADRVIEAMGWDNDIDKTIASIFTRMAKAIVRPDTIQG